jgi:hypothetical protein
LPLIDYDIWWHLACGRQMITEHVFLRSETFSHTLRGAPWINFEWLSQIGLYMLVKIGGLDALWVAKIALCLGVSAVFVAGLIRLQARGPWLWLLACVGFLALKPRLYERVELASLLLFPVCAVLLASLRSRPILSGRVTPWVIGAIVALWANLHGGFLYGLILIGAFCAGARWAHEDQAVINAFDRSFTVALTAMLINPFGPYVVNVFVEHWVQSREGLALIQEWAVPTVSQSPFFWALFVAAVAALGIGFAQRRPVALFWAPAVFLFAWWGTRSGRNTGYAVFVFAFLVADLVHAWPEAGRALGRANAARAGWALCFVLLFFFAKHELSEPPTHGRVQENRFPFGACAFVKTNGLNGTLYNTYHFGGVIEWSMGQALPVFMDGRYLFQPLLIEHARLDNTLRWIPTPDAWQDFFTRYHVDMAISEYGPLEDIDSRGRAPFSFASVNLMFPRTDWALVYWDDAALVFLKRIPRFADAIKRFEYTTVWPYNSDQMKTLLRSGQVNAAAVKADLQRNARARAPGQNSYILQHMENILSEVTGGVE